MLRDVRSEVVDLVTQSVEKVLLEKVDSTKDQELIERSVVRGVKK
jgi:F0F1-type ATP synthase membrane subunit b/b'